MADNVGITTGSDASIATDDVGGVQYQRVKLDIGGDGVSSPVIAGNGLPVTGPLTDTQLRATAVPVSLSGNQAVNQAQVAGTAVDVNNGAVSAGTQRVTIANNSTGILAAVTNVATIGTSVTPGTGATNLGKAVSSAAGATDTGVAALVLRDDVLATLSEADAEYTQLRVDSLGHLWTAGQVAHDSVITGAPVRIGARAMTADISSVASGDQCDILCDIKGKMVVLPYALNENSWQYAGPAITDTADDAVKASAGAGLRNYVTSLTVINSHATVGTVVELKDGSTVIHRGYAAPLGGGYTVTFPTALKGSAATAINVACVTTGSNTYVNASGYVAP